MSSFRLNRTGGDKQEGKRRRVFAEADSSSKKPKTTQNITEISQNHFFNGESEDDDQELVIPLIIKNKWKTPADNNTVELPSFGLIKQTKKSTESVQIDQQEDTIEQQAINALLEDSKKDSFMSEELLPILHINSVPGIQTLTNETEKFKHDVALRPEVCSLEEYEKVPIDQFGSALLRGMGWKQGMIVGKNQNQLINEKYDLKPRPHLLGLGAQAAPIILKDEKIFIKPGETRPKKPEPPKPVQETPEYDLEIGTPVLVIDGSNKNTKGIITEIKRKGKDSVVKVDVGEGKKIIKVWYDQVIPFTTTWIKPNLRVRISSSKGVIQDVFGDGRCSVRIGGRIQEYEEWELKTVVPGIGGIAMVVKSKNTNDDYEEEETSVGKMAEVKGRDDDRGKAVVQMCDSLRIVTVDYDEICEIVDI